MGFKLTADQTKKFVEGWNAKATSWNAGSSDAGKSPFRANTWPDMGYEAARSEIVRRQVAGEMNIILAEITKSEAQAVFASAYNQ